MTLDKYLLIFIFIFFSKIIEAQEIENCNCTPKSYKLLKVNGIQIDTSLVKTNGVYIYKDIVVNLHNKKQTRYSFYRFFDNGKVYKSCGYYNFPNNKDLNNLHYGIYGEYKIIDNKILLESHSSYFGYTLELYNIYGLKIKRIKIAKRRKKPKFKKVINSLEFSFHKSDLYSRPFW